MEVVAGVCQLMFVAYFTVTHWVSMPPFNDLRHEKRSVLALMQVVLGILAIGTLLGHRWALWCSALAYTLVFASHLLEWWIPYFTGRPAFALQRPKQETATYLPARGSRPVPDYLHTGIGLLVFAALITSWIAVVVGA